MRDLQSRQRLYDGAFAIIFVEISGHELGTVIRDILRRLKGPTNKSKYVTVLFTKTKRIHFEKILAVSPEILHTERDELALLSTNVLRDVIV